MILVWQFTLIGGLFLLVLGSVNENFVISCSPRQVLTLWFVGLRYQSLSKIYSARRYTITYLLAWPISGNIYKFFCILQYLIKSNWMGIGLQTFSSYAHPVNIFIIYWIIRLLVVVKNTTGGPIGCVRASAWWTTSHIFNYFITCWLIRINETIHSRWGVPCRSVLIPPAL